MTFKLLFAGCLLAIVGPQLSAQNEPEKTTAASPAAVVGDPAKRGILRIFLEDEKRLWTSPFRGKSYEGHTFRKYVIPFTLITAALIATDHKTANLLPNTNDQALWSRRVSQIGAPYTLAGMAAATYLISRSTHNVKAREAGFLGAAAIAHSQLITLVLKTATQRERPLDFRKNNSGGVAFWKGGNSFPSGHASGSFALATVFAYEYGHEHRWVPYTAYGLASVVALSRISAQKHWSSDLFVGGTMGFLIGRQMYKWHHNSAIDGVVPNRAERLMPTGVEMVGLGGRAHWDW